MNKPQESRMSLGVLPPLLLVAISAGCKAKEEKSTPQPTHVIVQKDTHTAVAGTVGKMPGFKKEPDYRQPEGPDVECYVRSEAAEAKPKRFSIDLTRSNPTDKTGAWIPLQEDDPLLKDKDIASLLARFKQEARRQIQAVRDAGGFCNLPLKFPDSTEHGKDDRLGEHFEDILVRRDEILRTRFPGVYMEWKVNLGRAMCEAAQAPRLFDGDYIPESQWRGLREAIQPLARRFNQMCIAAFEGRPLTQEPPNNDQLAVRRLLVRRGEIITGAIPRRKMRELERKWRRDCAEHTPEETPLSYEEREALLGSHWLMDEVVPDSGEVGGKIVRVGISEDYTERVGGQLINNIRGHAWRCEVPELDGLEEDGCGRVQKCVPLKGSRPDSDGWGPGKIERIRVRARGRRF